MDVFYVKIYRVPAPFYHGSIANFETAIFSDTVPIAKMFEILFTVILKTLNVKIVQGAPFYHSPIANFETVIFSDIVPVAKMFETLFIVISKDIYVKIVVVYF